MTLLRVQNVAKKEFYFFATFMRALLTYINE